MNNKKKVTIVNSEDSEVFKTHMISYFRKYEIKPDLRYVKKNNAINDFINNEFN